jgi:hypothetical protein
LRNTTLKRSPLSQLRQSVTCQIPTNALPVRKAEGNDELHDEAAVLLGKTL